MNTQKIFSFILAGLSGMLSLTFLGGRSYGLDLLVVSMCVDFLSGITISLIWHTSPKTGSGAYKSNVAFKGLISKCFILACVWITYMVEKASGFDGLREIVILGFAINEILSIIENLGIMGVPIPSPLKKALEILQQKEDNFYDTGTTGKSA